jgi:hypothetical protein
MILYIKIPEDATKTKLLRTNFKISEKLQDTKSTHKNQCYFYSYNKLSKKRDLRIPLTIPSIYKKCF